MEFRRKVLQADPGTEPYLAWALRRVRTLEALRRSTGLQAMFRVMSPASGVLVHLRYAGGQWSVRVTGGAAGRTRRLNTDAGEGAAFRWYHIKGGLDGYGEASRTGGQPNAQEVMSFDGSTLAYAATGSTDIKVMRKQRAPATYTRSTRAGLLADQLDWLTHGTRLTSAAGSDPYRVWDALKFNFGLTKGGKRLYALDVEPTLGTRQATALDVSSDDTATSLAQSWQSGVPQFVTDFYAARSPQHALHEHLDDTTLQVPDVLMFNPDASGYVLVPHWLKIPASGINQSLQLYVMWDPFAELPVVFASMPYATFVDNAPLARYDVSTSERVELRRLNPVTLGWDLLDSVDRGPAFAFAYASAAFMYNYAGFQALTSAAAGPDYGAKLTPTVGLDLQPSLLSKQAASASVRGKTFATPSGYDSVLNAARDAVYVHSASTGHNTWAGETWSLDFASLANPPIFSPHGELMWTGSNASGWDYYELGALKQHFVAAPAADATSFAAYGAASPAGFWLVNDVVGWRYDRPTSAKASVYTRVKLTPGNAGGLTHVYGGTINIPGFGSLPVNLANNNGFNQGGTLLIGSDGSTLTPAQIDVLFGVSGTTFVLDGTQYDLNTSGTPDTYSWLTATVDLKFAGGALKVAKTYSAKAVQVAARGGLGPGTVSTSEAEIAQDYLLFRKV